MSQRAYQELLRHIQFMEDMRDRARNRPGMKEIQFLREQRLHMIRVMEALGIDTGSPVKNSRKPQQRVAKPQGSKSPDTKPKEESDYELEAAHNVIKTLKKELTIARKRSKNRYSRDELLQLAKQCRKINGKINYSKLRREKLGVSNPTAKKWCNEAKIT